MEDAEVMQILLTNTALFDLGNPGTKDVDLTAGDAVDIMSFELNRTTVAVTLEGYVFFQARPATLLRSGWVPPATTTTRGPAKPQPTSTSDPTHSSSSSSSASSSIYIVVVMVRRWQRKGTKPQFDAQNTDQNMSDFRTGVVNPLCTKDVDLTAGDAVDILSFELNRTTVAVTLEGYVFFQAQPATLLRSGWVPPATTTTRGPAKPQPTSTSDPTHSSSSSSSASSSIYIGAIGGIVGLLVLVVAVVVARRRQRKPTEPQFDAQNTDKNLSSFRTGVVNPLYGGIDEDQGTTYDDADAGGDGDYQDVHQEAWEQANDEDLQADG
ncbi:uncharacterized protein MONBRDRAFT_30591, partial [Monosiga brevicollis MX1]